MPLRDFVRALFRAPRSGGERTITLYLWSAEPRPDRARIYFDALASRLEGDWVLEVTAFHGDPAVKTASVWQSGFPGPAAPPSTSVDSCPA